MKEEEINNTEVENKLSEEQIKQLEVLRSKNPKLWFRLLYGAYKPWLRKDNGGRNSKCECGSNKKTKHCCGVRVEYYTKPDKVKETKYGNTEVEI